MDGTQSEGRDDMISKAAIQRVIEEAKLSIDNREYNRGYFGMVESITSMAHPSCPTHRRYRNDLAVIEAASKGEYIEGIGGIFTVGLACATGHDIGAVLDWYRWAPTSS